MQLKMKMKSNWYFLQKTTMTFYSLLQDEEYLRFQLMKSQNQIELQNDNQL